MIVGAIIICLVTMITTFNLAKNGNNGNNISNSKDTSGMLNSGSGSFILSAADTSRWVNQVSLRNKYTDTSDMLSPYLRTSNIPAAYAPSNTTVTRPLNGTTFTPSTTKTAFLKYNIKISCTASIGSASDGKVSLQHSIDGGANWIDDGEIENSNTVTLALTLNAVTIQSGFIIANVPANALCRMNSTTSGTTTITYIRGFETY